MRKTFHVIITIFMMLFVSGIVVWLVDATVQIDDDIGMLITLLVILNVIIAGISLYLFRNRSI